jgi:hypothetical protein
LKSAMPSTPRITRFAVEHEALLADLAGDFDDPRVSARPVIAVAGEQTDAIAVPLDAEAITVVLHFMEPFGAGRHGLAGRGEAELKTGHGPKIGRVSRICESELQ